MKEFESGERVTWKYMDHGTEKKVIGRFAGIDGNVATVDVDGKTRTTVASKLTRCRGRKPGTKNAKKEEVAVE